MSKLMTALIALTLLASAFAGGQHGSGRPEGFAAEQTKSGMDLPPCPRGYHWANGCVPSNIYAGAGGGGVDG